MVTRLQMANKILKEIQIDKRQKVKPFFVEIPAKVLRQLVQRDSRGALNQEAYEKIVNLVLMEGVSIVGRGSEGFHNQMIDWLFFYYPHWNEAGVFPQNKEKEFHYFKSGITCYAKD